MNTESGIKFKKGGIYNWNDDSGYTIIIDYNNRQRVFGYDVINTYISTTDCTCKHIRQILQMQINDGLERTHSDYFWNETVGFVNNYLDGYVGQVEDKQLKKLQKYLDTH